MPSPIQLPDLTRGLRQSFELTGETRFSLDHTVSPVAVVRDLTAGPQEVLFGATREFTLDRPSDENGFLLGNPTTGVEALKLARVLRITLNSPSTQLMRLGRLDATPATVGTGTNGVNLSDLRPGQFQGNVALFEAADATAQASQRIAQFSVLGNTRVVIELPAGGIVMRPGTLLGLEFFSDANLARCSVLWTEFDPPK